LVNRAMNYLVSNSNYLNIQTHNVCNVLIQANSSDTLQLHRFARDKSCQDVDTERFHSSERSKVPNLSKQVFYISIICKYF
jgi:hypothetical protein